MNSENKFKTNILFYFLIVILIIQRLIHLSKLIEEPYAWRQFDTFYYALGYFKHGFNLLQPAVCWMGAYRTTILEFPIISFITALIFKIFTPSVFIARVVILLFYFYSCYFLFSIVKYIYYPRLAKLTLLIYMMFPVSLFYSRSIQVDFPAMAFSLGMLYYFLLGFDLSKIRFTILGCLFGCLAFLIKAPYPFYMFIPLLYVVYHKKTYRYFFKTLVFLILPVILFIIWEMYSVKVNSSSPDWFFIPDYLKFNEMSSWYFGNISQRFDFDIWRKIFSVFVESGVSYIGIPFFIAGFFLPAEAGHKKAFFFFYLLGILIYLLIFFKLVLIHEYYLIPFLIISSFFTAVSFDYLYRITFQKQGFYAKFLFLFLFLALIINCIWFTERWYYKVDSLRLETAEKINSLTGENALVIASIKDTDPRDPRILAPANREGWSIKIQDLTEDLIEKLISQGANYLAVTTNEKLDDKVTGYLSKFPMQENRIFKDGWILDLYTLTPHR